MGIPVITGIPISKIYYGNNKLLTYIVHFIRLFEELLHYTSIFLVLLILCACASLKDMLTLLS